MNNKYSFEVSKKKINIEYIYGSINITNIENYLKSIEELKQAEIIIIPNKYVYDDLQLVWSVFISKNRFVDKINVSKNLQTEVLLLLSLTDQINKIDKKFEIKTGVNDYFVFFVYEGKINLKDLKKKLNAREKKIEYDKQKAKEYYQVTGENVREKIIEKMCFV